MATKELSGTFISSSKWADAITTFQAPSCGVLRVRLFHNKAEQTAELFHALVQNVSVTELFLGHMYGTVTDAFTLYLETTKQLETLTVQQADDIGCMGAGLQSNTSITALHLSNCSSATGLQRLSSAIASRKVPLQQLSFKRCRFGLHAEPLTTCAFSKLSQLTALECHITDAALQAMLTRLNPLGSFWPSTLVLNSLDLSFNQIGPLGTQCLAALLTGSPSLERLVLSGNNAMGDDGAVHLAHAVACNPPLQHLDLSACSISTVGCRALAEALASNCSLHRLVLNSNAIDASGLVALLVAPGHCALQQLSLDHCQICGLEQQGTPAPLVSAPLQSLHIAFNPVADAGMAWLAQALSTCHTLTELDIAHAHISDTGAAQLVGLMARHPQLTTLLCTNNPIHDLGGQKLCTAAAQHPGLCRFKADECRISDPMLRARLMEVSKNIGSRCSVDEAQSQLDLQRQRNPCSKPVSVVSRCPPMVSSHGPYAGKACHASMQGGQRHMGAMHCKHSLERLHSSSDDDHAAKHHHSGDAAECAQALELGPAVQALQEAKTWPSMPGTESVEGGTMHKRESLLKAEHLALPPTACGSTRFEGKRCSQDSACSVSTLSARSSETCMSKSCMQSVASMDQTGSYGSSCARSSASSLAWGMSSYSRRFRPLSLEQQSLFVDF